MPYIGIDLHKEYTHFVVLNQNGDIIKRARIPLEREAVINFISELEGPRVAALEATCNCYWFYDLAEKMAVRLDLSSSA